MRQFPIRAAAFLEDVGGFDAQVLVLAEHEDGSGRRLELQRAKRITDQDRQLGMDTYSVANESGAVHYGGIRSWSLRGDELEVGLSSDAAATLAAEGGYLLTLVGPAARTETVSAGFKAITEDATADDS